MIDYINAYIKEQKYSINDNLDNLFNNLIDIFYDKTLESLNTIIFIMMDKYGYNPLEQNENIKKLVEIRTKQSKFREEIISRDLKCLITGDNYEICEACHIIPYCESKSFDIDNGLLFNKCFHKMFDTFKFSINSFDCIELTNKILLDLCYSNYHQYNGKKIKLTNGSKLLVKSHYEIFLNNNGISNKFL